MRIRLPNIVLFSFFALVSCQKTAIVTTPTAVVTPVPAVVPNATDLADATSGGVTTTTDATTNAFGDSFTNITAGNLVRFKSGNVFFNKTFTSVPGSDSSGLGPIFNNVSCVGCHNQNGRGKPPVTTETFHSLVFKLSIIGTDSHGGPLAAPGFGVQLQDQAIGNSKAEGQMSINYTEQPGSFPDGETYSLRRPNVHIVNPYIPVPAGILISARIAPSIFGLGLLESVPAQQITDLARSEASNTDGVHGKPNMVWDEATQTKVLGRFGWKANQSTLLQQTADALNQDMGITSSYFLTESSAGQSQAIPVHGSEISDASLNNLTLYVQALAPPARRNFSNAQVQAGYTLFIQAKCNSCHALTLQTGTIAGIPELSNQKIRPFTDMLIHNMGPGLNDNRPDFDAQGGDWRTAPLWGIGLNQIVNNNTFYLHDGRARNLTEAILWHDGEAATSKANYVAMTKANRTAVLTFLNNL